MDQKEIVIRDIESNGIIDSERASWKMLSCPPMTKIRREELFRKIDLSTDDTRPPESEVQYVCACGDQSGGRYYAFSHNRTEDKSCSLLITFEARFVDLIVDGRDFLYSLFQRGESGEGHEAAIDCFGKGVERYLNSAWSSKDQNFRIAMCDLAVEDSVVIRAHLKSRTVIGGRHNTQFCSAFLVKLPVLPRNIKSIEVIESYSRPQPKWVIYELPRPG